VAACEESFILGIVRALSEIHRFGGTSLPVMAPLRYKEPHALFAVQAIRSNVSAHRTGREADATLRRAGVSKLDLPSGFAALASRAADALENLRDLFEASE
jgi:hypothetical protein